VRLTATRCTCGTLQGLLSAAAFRPWRGSQAGVAQGPGRDAAHPPPGPSACPV